MVSSKAATPEPISPSSSQRAPPKLKRCATSSTPRFPQAIVESMGWGMISWDVPLEVSGPTYNGQPLVYAGLAAQKNHNALYLYCVYASPERSERLKAAFADGWQEARHGQKLPSLPPGRGPCARRDPRRISSVNPQELIRSYEASRTR